MKPVFERMDMIDEILKRRNYVTNAEHRFFMALLLNVEGRDRIFSLIKKRFTGADPLEKVLDWTFDLADTRVVGIEVSNALGIPDFGEPEMFVLENLLRGKTDEEIKQEFDNLNPNAVENAVSIAIAKVSGAVIFRPLMS